MQSLSWTTWSRKALPMVLDTARPKYKEHATWLGMHGRDAVRKSVPKVNKHFTGIHDRLLRDTVCRESQLEIGWSEQECKEWDEFAKEDHTCNLTPEERRRYKGQWYLTLNKPGKNGPMKLRSGYRAAVLMKNRLHHESGESIEEPIHSGQQRRIQQGQEVFSKDYFSSARVDQHTGWQYWLSSPSYTWWYASEWSWKWAHNLFVGESTVTDGVCRRIHLTRDFFLSLVLGLCPELQLSCGRERRALNPMRTRRMRSIAPWRYTTLSQVMSPTSSTTSSTTPTTHLCSDLPGWIRRHRHGTVVLVRCGTRRWAYRKSAIFTTVHSGARRTSDPETNLSLSWGTFVASPVLFHTHKYGETRFWTKFRFVPKTEIKSRSGKNERIRILLERQKEQILAEVRSEIQKHELRAESD